MSSQTCVYLSPVEVIPPEKVPRPLRLLGIHPPEPGLLQNEQVRKVVLLAQPQVTVTLHGPHKVDSAGNAQVLVLLPDIHIYI